MKKLPFIALVLFLMSVIFSCSNQQNKPQQVAELTENDSIDIVKTPYANDPRKTEYETPVLKTSRLRHGIVKRFYLEGCLYSEIPYKNGQMEGTGYTYYQSKNGEKPKVWKEQVFVDGKLTGLCKRYHENGKIQAEYEYKEGNLGIGMKEFTKEGIEIQQPELVVNSFNSGGQIVIKASLSKPANNVEYFAGSLIDGKFLNPKAKTLIINDGFAFYGVPSENTSKQQTISATFTTGFASKCLISKTINL